MAFLNSRKQRAGKSRTTAAKARRRARPGLELLEDRLAPATFTVINSLNTGPGSLSQAITDVNLSVADMDMDGVIDTDTIVFNIPEGDARHFYYRDDGVAGRVTHANVATSAFADDLLLADPQVVGAGNTIDPDWLHSWWTIAPGFLPTLIAGKGPVVIDGATQPGATENTLTDALDTVLRIELTGGQAGQLLQSSLNVEADDCEIKGLIINEGGNTGFQLIQLLGTQRCTVAGNFIGTDPSGLLDRVVSSNDIGVYIRTFNSADPSTANTVGGLTPDARNLISGAAIGVYISSGPNNRVVGNLIGTDRTGHTRLDTFGNSGGIFVESGANNNLIGGDTPAARNVISGHSTGVVLRGNNNNVIQGNYLGVDATGLAAVPNSFGIDFSSASPIDGSIIGGTTVGAGNVIAFSTNVGIRLFNNSQRVAILGNSIYSSGGLGIDLFNNGDVNGVTPNDESSSPYDTDTGANALQNYPVLTGITDLGGSLGIEGTLKSTANTLFRLEFFANPAPELPSHHGEGRTFLGAVQDVLKTMTDGTGLLDFTGANFLTLTANLRGTHYITATASPVTWDHDNSPSTPLVPSNTSEFSAEFQFNGPVNHDPVALDDPATTDEDVTKDIRRSDVLANDNDPDGDPLTVTVQSATHGTATYMDNGNADNSDDFIRFVPEPDYHGPATITYQISDGLDSDTAVINVTIDPVNDRPTFTPGPDEGAIVNDPPQTRAWASNILPGPADEAAVGQSVSLIVTENTNPGLFTAAGQPAIAANGQLTFAPAPGMTGSSQITVVARDSLNLDSSPPVTFTITVNPGNEAPMATDAAFRTASGQFFGSPVTIDLRTLVSDAETPDNDLVYEIVTQPNSTSFPLNPSGYEHTIVPVGNFVGAITFTYRVIDLGDGAWPPKTSDIKTVTINVTPERPDLRVFLTDTPDPAVQGEDMSYTIRVENHGPVAASNVDVGFFLPGDVLVRRGRIVEVQQQVTFLYVLTDFTHISYEVMPSLLGQTALAFHVNRPLRPVSEGDVATMQIFVRPLVANKTLTAQAGASSNPLDANAADNSAVATTYVNTPRADLSVSIVDSPDPAIVGEELVYRITVTNNGPQDAQNVRIKDVLPFQTTRSRLLMLENVTVEAAQGAWVGPNANQEISGTLATLRSGETITVTVRGRVLAQAADQSLTNRITVASDTPDTDPTNNAATATTQANPRIADLAVRILTEPTGPVIVGDQLVYRIEVTNNGPQAATHVYVRTSLYERQNETKYLSGVTIDQPHEGRVIDLALWFIDTLASGATTTLTVRGTVKPSAADKTLSTTADVSADEDESNLSNNHSVATTQVVRAPDLGVTIAGANHVTVNTPLTYTIKVKNNGPGAASGVQLTVNLPAGVTFVSVTPNQGAAGPANGTLIGAANGTLLVALGNLSAGAERTLTVKVVPRKLAQLVTTATVAGDRPDSDTSNNRVTLTTAAGPEIELIDNGSFEPLQPNVVNPWTLTGGAGIVRGHLELRPFRNQQQVAVQTVSVPALSHAPFLMFTLATGSPDPRNRLVVEMLINGNILVPLFDLDGAAANMQYRFDLATLVFEIQTVELRFRAVTSNERDINFTTWKIDDVSLRTDLPPALTINDLSLFEANPNTPSNDPRYRRGTQVFHFRVSLSAASDRVVTVLFGTADGTAKSANKDYEVNVGLLTFAPGETRKTIEVVVLGDRNLEGHETFFVNLGLAINAVIGDDQGVGTIWNDD